MPSIRPLTRLIAPEPGPSIPSPPISAWIVVVISIALVIIVGVTVFVTLRIKKRRQYREAQKQDPSLWRNEFDWRQQFTPAGRQEEEAVRSSISRRSFLGQYKEAQKLDPYLSRKEFLRRQQLTPAERQEEEETQRRSMIRKSLLSRSSPRNSQAGSDDIDLEDGERPTRGLKEDWKEYEAQLQKERSLSGERHPSLGSDDPIVLGPIRPQASSPQPHMPPIALEVREAPLAGHQNPRQKLLGTPDIKTARPTQPTRAHMG